MRPILRLHCVRFGSSRHAGVCREPPPDHTQVLRLWLSTLHATYRGPRTGGWFWSSDELAFGRHVVAIATLLVYTDDAGTPAPFSMRASCFETSCDTQCGCTPEPHHRGASCPIRAFRLKGQRQRGFPVHTFPQTIMEPTNTLIPVRYEMEGDISISNESPSPTGGHNTRIGGGPSPHQSSDCCAQGYVHTGFFLARSQLKWSPVLQM